ncbi:MAG: cation transporter [Melioribacteraceae bacterium]|nr:cation transporter [Melioribacteraceae bacterium]WKZ70471.1 MAG: cation transporter [Melioribacteraceae bacterium]
MKKEYKVEGMSCQHCVHSVVLELNKLEINSHQVDIGRVSVDFDETKVNDEQIKAAIEEAGYKVVN